MKFVKLIFSVRAASPTLACQSDLVLEQVQFPQLHRAFSDSAKGILTAAALRSVLR